MDNKDNNNNNNNNIIISPENSLLDQQGKDFLEWFRGFVDAEGYFTIANKGGHRYLFTFGIGLHADDLKVLEFIHQTLQMEKIYMSSRNATLMIRSKDELKRIIEIFNKAPLNSNKQLNFIAFREAFELYLQHSKRKENTIFYIEQMEAIRSSMNRNRTDFVWPNREFNITPNWLLGFVEGDGSFSVRKLKTQSTKYNLVFSISQSETDLALLIAIQNHLNRLAAVSSTERTFSYSIIPTKGKYHENHKFALLSSSACKNTTYKKFNLAIQDSHF